MAKAEARISTMSIKGAGRRRWNMPKRLHEIIKRINNEAQMGLVTSPRQ
jgi:HD-like signal output (HDOD) protein